MFRVSKLALLFCLGFAGNEANAFVTPSHDLRTCNEVSTLCKSSPIAFVRTPSTSSTLLRMSDAETLPTKLVRKPESAVELTITAPGPATKAAFDKACAEISKTISIPGFRKGAKIPPAVLENAMAAKGGGNALRTQAIQSLLNQLLEPALKEEHNLEPIGQPSLVTSADKLAESFVPGEPIEMVVACDVWPDIKWKEVEGQEKPYMGLKGSYKRKPFNQAQFDRAQKDLAERYAVTEPAPEGTELAMGDACVVNMEGFMALEDGVTKGDPLPNAASGDNVEVILGQGRYMEGLVEGLLGAKVGETKPIYVTFPEKLRDKTLAGKKAIFDVTVLEANTRTVPEIDDELANKIRPGLDAEGIRAELRKAVDENDSGEWMDARNKALAASLSEIMDVDVPDTLVTNQAREKYAQMMSEFRGQGMADEEIKKLITPENFLKYKDIEKADIVKDFKTSMATDEIARLENIEVPSYQVEEQLEAVKKEANGEDLGDENILRSKIESTLMRRMVYDFLAEHSDLTVEYTEEPQFDEALMEQLAAQTIENEGGNPENGKSEDAEENLVELQQEESETVATSDEESVASEKESEAEVEAATDNTETDNTATVEAATDNTAQDSQDDESISEERRENMDLGERAFNDLVKLGLVDISPDPDSPDYDHSDDDEIAAENVFVN